MFASFPHGKGTGRVIGLLTSALAVLLPNANGSTLRSALPLPRNTLPHILERLLTPVMVVLMATGITMLSPGDGAQYQW